MSDRRRRWPQVRRRRPTTGWTRLPRRVTSPHMSFSRIHAAVLTAVTACLLAAPSAALAATSTTSSDYGEDTKLNLPSTNADGATAATGGGGGNMVRTFVGLAVVVGRDLRPLLDPQAGQVPPRGPRRRRRPETAAIAAARPEPLAAPGPRRPRARARRRRRARRRADPHLHRGGGARLGPHRPRSAPRTTTTSTRATPNGPPARRRPACARCLGEALERIRQATVRAIAQATQVDGENAVQL